MPSRNPLGRLHDIRDNIERVWRHVEGMDCDAYLADEKAIDATERCLMRISEAAVKLDDAASELMPDYPWADVRGYGNWLRHQYDHVPERQSWTIIAEHLPALYEGVLAAIERVEQRSLASSSSQTD